MANISRYSGSLISEIIDGEHVDVCPEHTPADWMADAVQMVKVGSNIIVGYLCHDDDCENPLDNDCCIGEIHHHPDSRYGRRESNYYEVLGLGIDGEPNLDLVHDALVRDAYIAHFLSVSSGDDLPRFEGYWDRRDGEDDGAYMTRVAGRDFDESSTYGGSAGNCVYPEALDELRLAEWTRMRDAGELGDRDAVLLDLYEHSGVAYSVSGHGMQCRWDTSSGAAVWVPSETAREEIDRRAPAYAFGQVRKLKTKWHAIPTGTAELGAFDTWHEAFNALKQYGSVFDCTDEMLAQGRYRAAEELASQACETYTAWANGDCYYCVVEKHELAEDGSTAFVEELCGCGGIIGSDWAEQELEDQFNYFVNESTKK